MKITIDGAESTLDGEVQGCGTGGHVRVPRKHLGRKVKIVIMEVQG